MSIHRWTWLLVFTMLACRPARSPTPPIPAETCKPSSGPTKKLVLNVVNAASSPITAEVTVDGCGGGPSARIALPQHGTTSTVLEVTQDRSHRIALVVEVRGARARGSRVVAEFEDEAMLVVSEKDGLPVVLGPGKSDEPDAATCTSASDAPLVPIRIRFADTMSTAFVLRRLDLLLDGKPLVDDATKLAQDASTGRSVTIALPARRGCHTLSVKLEYQGHGEGLTAYLQGYKFKVTASRRFEVVEGGGIDIVGYEDDRRPLEERPALRLTIAKPPKAPS